MLSGGKRGRSYLNSTTNIESLPDELLFDILLRFPADFLHHGARLVCRRWRRIIQYSDGFINTHIQQHSSTNGLVLSSQSHSYPHSIYVTATQEGRIEISELMSYISMATSCNGLSLEVNALSLHAINPATKQSFCLPSVSTHKRHVYYRQSAIAYSAASMDYKVTLPYTVYSGGQLACLDIVAVGVDKSWRHVEIPSLPKNVGSFFHLVPPLSSEGGFLHWGRGRYCLTLNVETEIITMSEVHIPPHRSYLSVYYLSTGRSLSLLVGRIDFSWEVWEMRPAESGDQWRKAVLPNIDLEPKKCKLLQQLAIGSDKRRLLPLGWVKYPEVLAFLFSGLEKSTPSTCISYNLETREINTIDLQKQPCCEYRAFVHRNSLVWLNQDD